MVADVADVRLEESGSLAGVGAVAGLVADNAVAAKASHEKTTQFIVAGVVADAAAGRRIRRFEIPLTGAVARAESIAGIVPDAAAAIPLPLEHACYFSVAGAVADLVGSDGANKHAGCQTVAGAVADIAVTAVYACSEAGDFTIARVVADDTFACQRCRFGAGPVCVAGAMTDACSVAEKQARTLDIAGLMVDDNASPIALVAAKGIRHGRSSAG